MLLDTHVWLWAAANSPKLKANVARQLSGPDSTLYLSPISIWEVAALGAKGRLGDLTADPLWFDDLLEWGPLSPAPLSFAVTREAAMLDWSHKDPADRFLVATARMLGLVLVTADERIINSRLVPVMDAR